MKKAVKQSEHHNFPNKTNETKIDSSILNVEITLINNGLAHKV